MKVGAGAVRAVEGGAAEVVGGTAQLQSPSCPGSDLCELDPTSLCLRSGPRSPTTVLMSKYANYYSRGH